MNHRTIRNFEVPPDFPSILGRWASEEGFVLLRHEGGTTVFRKQVLGGFWLPPMIVQIESVGTGVRLSAWVDGRSWRQLWGLFLTPREMALEKGGMRGSAPRKVAREAVNRLLEQVGQSPIPRGPS